MPPSTACRRPACGTSTCSAPAKTPKASTAPPSPTSSRNAPRAAPTVYGDGEQTRDFCYVDNVVHANLLALESPAAKGQAVNIGCGRRISVNQIVSQTNALLGTKIEPDYQPSRPGDVRDSLADVSLAKQVIGFEPVVFFDEGLQRSIDWYRKALG